MAKAKELRQDIVDLLDEFYGDDADFILKLMDELLRETAVEQRKIMADKFNLPEYVRGGFDVPFPDNTTSPNTGDKNK